MPAADETYLRAVVRDLCDGRRDEVLAVHVAATAHRGGLPCVTGHRLVEVTGQLRQGRGVVGGFVEAAHQGGDPGDGVQPLAAYVTDEQAHAVRGVLRRVEVTSDGCRGGRRLVTDRDPGLPPPGPHGREHGALGALRHPLGSLEPAPQRNPQPAQGHGRPGEDHHGDVVDHRVTAVGRQVSPEEEHQPGQAVEDGHPDHGAQRVHTGRDHGAQDQENVPAERPRRRQVDRERQYHQGQGCDPRPPGQQFALVLRCVRRQPGRGAVRAHVIASGVQRADRCPAGPVSSLDLGAGSPAPHAEARCRNP